MHSSELVGIYKNDQGRTTYLRVGRDESGREIWSAFVGKQGGDLRQWKTLKGAEKALEARGWKKLERRTT
ncbi:MAG: hypothetical protein PHS57_06275 [Alphaproteobacteria bacterium]|nr:hypothetical protein [Alphaproteobacteria bacterium]